MVGALAAAMLATASINAQAPFAITVEDSHGAALAGAAVEDSTGKLLGRTDSNGELAIACKAPCSLRVSAAGFAEKALQLSQATTIRLDLAASSEQIMVTAYRAPLGSLESPVTTRLLTETALNTTASVTLDGEMRQLPGVELFRRSSSLVANPSSQGISLRGLGSTSASRTLLTEDDVPLNDAFAGTVHWMEQPELAIERIEVVRGGASDLYGSSAIGGVVNVVPERPSSDSVEFKSSYGAESTYDNSLLLQAKHGPWGLLTSGNAVGTDGFIQEAPQERRPVDIASNVHGQNGVCWRNTIAERSGYSSAAAASTRRATTEHLTRPMERGCGATRPAQTGAGRTTDRWLPGSTDRPIISARRFPASRTCRILAIRPALIAAARFPASLH